MNLKRLAVASVVALAASLVPASMASAGAGTANVTVLHGIGPAPSAVDVYLGETDATEWDLVIEDLAYGESVDLGLQPAGGYNVLLCAAVGAPLDQITGCADNTTPSINGNFGTNVDLENGVDEVWVAAYGDPSIGRPTVLEVEPDLDCVEPEAPARVTAVHAATAPEVNVLADGDEVVSDLAWGESAALDVPEGSIDVEVELTTGDPVLSVDGVDLAAETNTMLVVVGNPQFDASFDVVSLELPLEECEQPTTTTSTTTTTVAATPAVQPRFTG